MTGVFAVLEDNGRRGLANRVDRQAAEIAREIRAFLVYIQADPPDEPAVKLYEPLGTREDVLHFDIEP